MSLLFLPGSWEIWFSVPKGLSWTRNTLTRSSTLFAPHPARSLILKHGKISNCSENPTNPAAGTSTAKRPRSRLVHPDDDIRYERPVPLPYQDGLVQSWCLQELQREGQPQVQEQIPLWKMQYPNSILYANKLITPSNEVRKFFPLIWSINNCYC